MAGQAGSARNYLNHTSETTALSGGIVLNPTDRFTVGLDAIWSNSTDGLDRFGLTAAQWAATHPAQGYDFSNVPEYSALDISRVDVTLDARYRVSESFWFQTRLRHAGFDDQATYVLDDRTGSFNSWSIGVGKAF